MGDLRMSRKNNFENLENTLKEALEKHILNFPSNRIVIAVSGGVDSLALMHVCGRWKEEWNVEFFVATIDHGLRGSTGLFDCVRVKNLAETWGINCVSEFVDTKSKARISRLNLEETARKSRYEFFVSLANKTKAVAILTAHHKDDQVETVLSQLIRGCGINGLKGIQEQRIIQSDPEIYLIRPFLQFKKKQLEKYAELYSLKPSIDATNYDLNYKRNRLRHETIPHLKEYNPKFDSAITRLASIATETEDYLASQSSAFITRHCCLQDSSIAIPKKIFLLQHKALQIEILRNAISNFNEYNQPYYGTLLRLWDLINSGQGEKYFQITNTVHLRLAYENVFIENNQERTLSGHVMIPVDCNCALKFPGKLNIPRSEWSIEVIKPTHLNKGQICLLENLKIVLRTRRRGDRFAPYGLNGKKKTLKRWLIDKKVPKNLRASLPLITNEDEIMAIYWKDHWYVSHNYHPKYGTNQLIYSLNWEKLS